MYREYIRMHSVKIGYFNISDSPIVFICINNTNVSINFYISLLNKLKTISTTLAVNTY